jgi:hypothetical protein
VELFKDRASFYTAARDNNMLMVSVTKIYLENIWSEQTVRKLETQATGLVSATLNAAIYASTKIIMGQLQSGVNNWGASEGAALGLTFPLDVLNGLPLGPSAPCIGQSDRLDRCRAKLRISIPVLEFNENMELHLVIEASPFVERAHIAATVAESTHLAAWIGKPMLYQSVDGRGANMTYSDAMDLCVHDVGECESVWAELRSNGRLQYRLGRTRYPVPDSEDNWRECGNEGDFCRYTDDESKFGNPETGENMWNFSEHGGHTDARRMMRMRFGMFRSGTTGDYVEKVGYDAGTGVPCRQDFFDVGVYATGQDVKEVLGPGPYKCKRLGVGDAGVGPHGEAPERSKLVSTVASEHLSTDITCPLERPCIAQSCNPPPCMTYCIPVTANSERNHGCPTSPPSVHAWFKKGQMPFTQPVSVARRTALMCSGPEHLACWPDHLHASDPPPPLGFADLVDLPTSVVKLSLPTDVINSLLATVYKSGILSSKVFDLEGPVPNVSALCGITSGYLCPKSSMSDDTPVKLTVRQTMPASVTTTATGLRVSLALELILYGWDREATGIPLETVIPPNKMCTIKEGFMTVTRKYLELMNGENTKFRWFELTGRSLRMYTAHGRQRKKAFDLSDWTIEKDQERPKCIKLKRTMYKTRKLCTESDATREEWYTAMVKAATSPISCKYPALDKQAARVKFGVDLDAGVDVAKERYLCVRPNKAKVKLTHVGTLHTGSSWSSKTLTSVTALGVRGMLSTILKYFGLLNPMQVWNLMALGKDKGLAHSRIEIGQNRIYIEGQVTNGLDAEEIDDAGFNNADDNPCVAPGDAEDDGGMNPLLRK